MAGRAAQLGIPAPATIAIPGGRHGQAVVPLAVRQLGTGPYIIKPRQMAMGTGVLKADTPEQLAAAVDLAAWSDTGHIIQAFHACHGDIRAHYADGQVIAAMLRVPAPCRYRANVSQGGTPAACTCPEEIAAMTCRIAASLKASQLTVDWMITDRGPMLGEWSAGVGGFADLPEPERGKVGDAHFGWARRRYQENPVAPSAGYRRPRRRDENPPAGSQEYPARHDVPPRSQSAATTWLLVCAHFASAARYAPGKD
jgi:hypothetical protein